MERYNVSSGSPFEKSIGFSRAVRIGNIIAVSGTAPIPQAGESIDMSSVYEQTRLCLNIIAKAVKEAGGHQKDIIRTRVFLTDIKRWEEAARAHGEMFGEIRPACTFVEVKGLIDPKWFVEIEADCVVP